MSAHPHPWSGDIPNETQVYPPWRRRHPYVFYLTLGLGWIYYHTQKALVIAFAPWPSMHDPIKALLNVQDQEAADRLTEKWTDAKLGELQYVGVTNGLVTSTVAAAFSWASIPTDPWSVDACWMSSLVLALTAISLAAQQTIGLNRLRSCENGLLKIRHLLGEAPEKEERHPTASHGSDAAKDDLNGTRIKRIQLWAWQTPIMMSNFAILLFIVGLMIAIFARAAAAMGDWSKPDGKIAVFFGGATIFAGVNYLICWISLNRGSLVSSTQLKTLG